MKTFFSFLLLYFLLLNSSVEEYVEVKCMLEIVNYRGEGAYIAISVIDKSEKYIKTVYVFGDDKSWFSEMKSFWRNLRENNLFLDKDFYPLVDAISGPTISGSERRLFQFKIPKNLFNSNYNLRIETAVEDKGYYVNDIIINLNPENLKKIYQGEGFINKIQFSAVDK